jgi:predicted nucleotidyltransferase
MLNKNFREFLKLLIDNDVRFVVVGGYAVGVHGFPRYTGDIDVFVAIETDNAARLMRVFDLFGFGDLGVSELDFQQPDSVIEIGREPNKIQVLTGIDGVEFDAVFANRIAIELDGLPVPFIGIDDLLKNKKAAGRSKDLIDFEELLRLNPRKTT